MTNALPSGQLCTYNYNCRRLGRIAYPRDLLPCISSVSEHVHYTAIDEAEINFLLRGGVANLVSDCAAHCSLPTQVAKYRGGGGDEPGSRPSWHPDSSLTMRNTNLASITARHSQQRQQHRHRHHFLQLRFNSGMYREYNVFFLTASPPSYYRKLQVL